MSRDLRIRWEFEPKTVLNKSKGISDEEKDRLAILSSIHELISGTELISHYQPIYSTADGSVFGFEALARLQSDSPFLNISEMFHASQTTGTLAALDAHCMETALRCLDIERFAPSRAFLFLNACPETLMNPDVTFDIVNANLAKLSLSPERIILEINEESVVSNYELFRNSLKYFRHQGFKIAIDDFGSGYAGLKMLSTIEPDFLKIDRHFIENIDHAIIKFNLVDAITTACNRIGIHIVAEGIERPEELEIVNDFGIEYLQGFVLSRPSPGLDFSSVNLPNRKPIKAGNESIIDRYFIGDIIRYVEPMSPSDLIVSALNGFMKAKGLYALPVVENKKVVGILNRNRFFEEQLVNVCHQNHFNTSTIQVGDIMEREVIYFDMNCTLSEASKKINAQSGRLINDNLVVLKHGYYHGMLELNLLLDALAEQNILLAKDSNPLSGLPGNNTIQREITRRLAQNMHFDVLYIDIDHFKPFNDYYNFALGDRVIIDLSKIISRALEKKDSPFNFAGHIGGDDFIVITRPAISLDVARCIIEDFTNKLEEYHGREDYKASSFVGTNRKGEKERFGLLSLSIGIVSTEVFNISSYSQFASISCEVKKAAKLQKGSSIARDRRLLGLSNAPFRL
jgi:diguanylate cyclase (GGDEF)-like protein